MRIRWTGALIAVAGAIALAIPAHAQYPGQYPPGTYPPNTYPPGTYPPGSYPPGSYPPNTYPPNTVPVRLPGNVPVGVPMPEPKLPRKESKGTDEGRLTVATVDGTLRKLGEKEMVLGIKKGLLQFRLLPKTKFVDVKGEYMRDSLLHPGDQLQAQVNPDDPETALRVVFLRAGMSAERTASERPFDPDSARAPKAGDLSKTRTVITQNSGPGAADAPDAAPAVKTEDKAGDGAAASGAPAASGPAAPDPGGIYPDSRPQTDDVILADARTESAKFSASLPNYLAQQVTTRYFATGFPARWQAIDVVTAELSYVNGKEDYKDFRIDNEPIDRPVENTGAWSTGEFATTLDDVLSASTAAHFRRRPGEDTINGRKAWAFDYTVDQANSHWTMVAADGRHYNPGYSGAIWIDRETRRVLRVEQTATQFPRDLWLSRADSTIEYGYVKIDQKTYLMPAKGDTMGCMSGSGACSRNEIEFRNYRKFTAESKVDFGK